MGVGAGLGHVAALPKVIAETARNTVQAGVQC